MDNFGSTGSVKPHFSDELKNKLQNFIVNELGGKAIDGVTYTMIKTGPAATNFDAERLEDCKALRKEADICGFGPNELVRVYPVYQGVVYDVDMNVVNKIQSVLVNNIIDKNGQHLEYSKAVGNRPEMRRKSDMLALAKYVQKKYLDGQNIIDIVIFSRNTVPEAVVSGVLPDGRPAIQRYKAFAVRQSDFKDINRNILMPIGYRIKSLAPGPVLPSRQGVVYQIVVEAVAVKATNPNGVTLQKSSQDDELEF